MPEAEHLSPTQELAMKVDDFAVKHGHFPWRIKGEVIIYDICQYDICQQKYCLAAWKTIEPGGSAAR